MGSHAQRILASYDAEETVRLFHRFFKDKSERGGFYSHIDPITFDPLSDALGHNRGRKNWNSVGDHAPAYLINLWLATGAPHSSRASPVLARRRDTLSWR